MSITYLDWAATAPPDRETIEEQARVAEETFGNPSSPHTPGRAARELLESARARCARVLGTKSDRVIFTSSGTEANNMVLLSLLARRQRGGVVLSGIEHPSVYEPARLLAEAGFAVRFIPAEASGIVSPGRVLEAIDDRTLLVALMLVNNETGAIQPVSEVARALRRLAGDGGRTIHLHSDCVQALGKVPVDCDALGVNSASFSGHKLGAPRGCGLLYLNRPIAPLYRGGGQESSVRPGTENLAAICATALALERHAAAVEPAAARARELKALLIERIRRIEGLRFIPAEVERDPASYSPYILNFAIPPLPGEVLVRLMNDRGFAISTGSACSTRRQKHLRVLSAMGVDPKTAFSAIRVSIGFTTTRAEIERFCDEVGEAVASVPLAVRA